MSENQSSESRKRTADEAEVESVACAAKSSHENIMHDNFQVDLDLQYNEILHLPALSPISSNSSVTIPKRKCIVVEKSDNRALCIPDTSCNNNFILSEVMQKLALKVVKDISKDFGSENFSPYELEMILSITREKLKHTRCINSKLSVDQDKFFRTHLEPVNSKSGLIFNLSIALAFYLTQDLLHAAIVYAQFTFRSVKNLKTEISRFIIQGHPAFANRI